MNEREKLINCIEVLNNKRICNQEKNLLIEKRKIENWLLTKELNKLTKEDLMERYKCLKLYL